MSGSIAPDDQWLIPCIRSQTWPVCDVWCGPHDTAPTTRHPRSARLGSILHFHLRFWHGRRGRDVRLGPELRLPGRPGWTWRGRARPVQCATRGPGRHTGAAMRARLSCEWSEESETCEWWLCSSHCMAPHPSTKYAKKWRPWGGHTLAPGLGFWPWLWQQTLLYRPQQPENHLGRPPRQVTSEQPGHTEHNIPSCFTFFVA